MSLALEIAELEQALRREQVSPELLPYEENLINKVVVNLDEKQDTLNSISVDNHDQQFDIIISQLDIDRVKYLLSNYLRTRMLKIQQLAFYIVLNDFTAELSDNEFEFASKYFAIKTNHFKKTFLTKIPMDYMGIEKEEHNISPDSGPDMGKHVFIKAKEDIGNIEINGTNLQISKNDVYLIQYSSVKQLLKDRRVDLI